MALALAIFGNRCYLVMKGYDDRIYPTFRRTPSQLRHVQGSVECSSCAEHAMPPPSRSHLVDHLGLVAALCDARGMGEGSDRATRHPPDTRLVTTGEAGTALVRHGLGWVHQPRYWVPRLIQDHPPSRRLAPGLIDASQLHDEALGRALDTL